MHVRSSGVELRVERRWNDEGGGKKRGAKGREWVEEGGEWWRNGGDSFGNDDFRPSLFSLNLDDVAFYGEHCPSLESSVVIKGPRANIAF